MAIDSKAGERYWWPVKPVWAEVSVHNGPQQFLRHFGRLRPEVSYLYAAHWCQSEVRSGGFRQFSSNSTGVLAPEALAAFRAIGLAEWGDLLEEAARFFGDPFPRSRDVRRERLREGPVNEGEDWSPFEAMDDRFYACLNEEESRWDRAADAYASRVGS